MVNDSECGSVHVRDQAARWVLQLHTSENLASLVPAFQAWLDAAPEHRYEYLRLERTWRDLDELHDQLLRKEPGGPTPEVTGLVPRMPVSGSWAKILRVTACVLALMAISLASYLIVSRRFTLNSCDGPSISAYGTCKLSTGQYSADNHRVASLQLIDGSEIELDVDSQVTLDLSAGHRRVRLDRGEALFSVAQNLAVPFDVQVGPATVRALGTVFAIENQGTDRSETVVQVGQVEVLVGRQMPFLVKAGERVEVDATQVHVRRRQ